MPGTSTMLETLTPIWQRVLQRSDVGPDDNFFDLGGDSSLALELFNEVGRVCGRDFPPVMIYHAPTITALAALLEENSAPSFPPVVLLKPGNAEPPVFITHGLGGSVIDFYQVVRHIQTLRAIYGMQGKGIDGVEQPFDRVEDMAQYSLDAIKQLQPRGPYLLIGFSLGGLVTLEMAQRLKASGEEVTLLAMLDSYPHINFLSRGQRMLLAFQQTQRRITNRMTPRTPDQFSAERPLSPALQRCRESAYVALERYEPRFYSGKINFVRAAVPTTFSKDPVPIWKPLAKQLVVDTVPGDHLEIMTTHYQELAALLSRYLSESLPSSKNR